MDLSWYTCYRLYFNFTPHVIPRSHKPIVVLSNKLNPQRIYRQILIKNFRPGHNPPGGDHPNLIKTNKKQQSRDLLIQRLLDNGKMSLVGR